MVTKMSASGEWLIPESNIPSAVSQTEISSQKTGLIHETGHICFECSHSYRACDCKTCLKCGSPFMKYFGTSIVKGRSHCRVCSSPVCSTCIILIKDLQKVCTRCHLKQKEDEITTEKALSAICEAKFGLDHSSILTKLKTSSQKTQALLEAAKNGHDHLVVTLLNLGCDANIMDMNGNTPLFYAAESGSLACVALLVEKGANIFVTNNVGWSALHAVAWKGSTENHVECAELLLEMGVEVLQESDVGETAGDLASRCGGTQKMIQILRAAEIEVSLDSLEAKSMLLMASSNDKEKKFGKLIHTILKYYSKTSAPIMQDLSDKKVTNQLLLPAQTLPKTGSLDRMTTEKHALCYKCKGPKLAPAVNLSPAININNRPKADVEPIIRTTPSVKPPNNFYVEEKKKQLEDSNLKLLAEKNEWEDRCRKLMASVVLSTKDHKKQLEDLQKENERLREEKVDIVSKCDATYANKIVKIKIEFEESINELNDQLSFTQAELADLQQLQKQYKLTWLPDHLVKECQQNKCRLPFTKTCRKHHCRCCGRVFCFQCSPNKISLPAFGYMQPVRVCNSCFALVDDILKT